MSLGDSARQHRSSAGEPTTMNRKANRHEPSRRRFLKHASLGGLAFTSGVGGILYSRRAPAVSVAPGVIATLTTWRPRR